MADTSLSAQIEHDYKVSKWSRNTVADGSWLQKYTVERLTNRDIFLANAIDTLNSGTDENLSSLSAAISYVSATHDEYIDYLSATISGTIYDVSALNEKVSSFSSEYRTFYSATNNRFNNIESNASGLQNQIDQLKIATDVINVFGTHDEFTAASASTWQQQVTDNDTIKVLNDNDEYQVYYEWHDPYATQPHTDWTGWSAIGSLDPYYSTNEIDDYFEELSATVSNNYLSAKGAVLTGRNIAITENANYPKITIATKDDVDFNTVSAATAYGSSAKFTNISATNISANLFKSDFGTVDTWQLKFNSATGDKFTTNEANIIQLTANTLYGQSNNSNVDSLIGSAQIGAKASAYITAHSGDFLNSAHSAYGKLTFGTKAYPATSYNYNFTFLAGQGISFTTGNNQVTISAEGTTYSDSTYISTANKTISVKDTLIGSAQSGKRAYNILSGTKISAVGSQFTDTAFGYLSAGFRISAGDNLTISAGANNTIQLNAKPSIDTTFSNIWYEGGAEPLGETGTITGITAKFNNDLDSHNHIVNQSVVFGTSGNEVISGLLIQPADPTEDGNVLTYNSLNNSYTWQPGGTTYTTANENIVINNGLKTIGLASSVSSNDLHLTGTNGVVISLNCNYISGYYAGSTTDFTAKMNWRDLLTLNYVSSCNKLGSDGLPVIRVSACSQIPSISEMVEGIYYLV
jgi:hypothetical protein